MSLISRSCANIAQVLPKCKCYLLNVVSHITISISADRIRRRFGSVGNVVGRIKEVNQRLARLVLGWVTVFVKHCVLSSFIMLSSIIGRIAVVAVRPSVSLSVLHINKMAHRKPSFPGWSNVKDQNIRRQKAQQNATYRDGIVQVDF